MARRSAGRRITPAGRSKIAGRYIYLDEVLLASAAYRSLSPVARCLLVELLRRFDGSNNGKIALSVRDAARLSRSSKDTAKKAFDDLQDRGFVERTLKGAFSVKNRLASEWRLTFRETADGTPATRDFQYWRLAGEKKSTVRNGGTHDISKPDRDMSPDTSTSDRQSENRDCQAPTEGRDGTSISDTYNLPRRVAGGRGSPPSMPPVHQVVAGALRPVEAKRERARAEVALIRARRTSAAARNNWFCLLSFLATLNAQAEAKGFAWDAVSGGPLPEGRQP